MFHHLQFQTSALVLSTHCLLSPMIHAANVGAGEGSSGAVPAYGEGAESPAHCTDATVGGGWLCAW